MFMKLLILFLELTKVRKFLIVQYEGRITMMFWQITNSNAACRNLPTNGGASGWGTGPCVVKATGEHGDAHQPVPGPAAVDSSFPTCGQGNTALVRTGQAATPW